MWNSRIISDLPNDFVVIRGMYETQKFAGLAFNEVGMLHTLDHCELCHCSGYSKDRVEEHSLTRKGIKCRLLTEGVGNVWLVARKHETGSKKASRMTTCYAAYKPRLGVECPLGKSRWEMSLVLGRAF